MNPPSEPHTPVASRLRTLAALTCRWRPGRYARDSLRVSGWLLLRTLAQAAMVLLLARWLGAEGYGTFVAALAVASFFTPLAGLGLGGVLLVQGARGAARIPMLMKRSGRIWALSATVCTLLAVAAMSWTLPGEHPRWAFVALASAEVAAVSWVEIAARAAQSRLHAHRFGALQAGLPMTRLIALVLAMMLVPASPASWMAVYALASLLYAGVLMMRMRPSTDGQAQDDAGAGSVSDALLVRQGLPFAAGAVATRLQAEFNKPVLAQVGYLEVGALSVAQRIIDLVTLPLAALQEALWPRVFGAQQPLTRLGQTGAVLVALALAGGGILALAAPIVPWLLGDAYGPASHTLVWLAGLPAVQVLRNLGNVSLVAQGRHRHLLGVYSAAALSGILLTILLVPSQGMIGAMWAIYASEGVAAVLAWVWSERLRAANDDRHDP